MYAFDIHCNGYFPVILFFYFGSLIGLYSLISKHCNDFIFVSQVKLEGIRSGTLAEMRQNDL